MADLHFTFINQTHVRIDCESWLFRELDERFTFYVPGYKFMPRYKAGIWDGKFRLLDYRTQTTLVGLIPEIVQYCRDSDYTVNTEEVQSLFKSEHTAAEIISFIENLRLPFQPHDYQLNAVMDAILHRRKIALSATGSGKSLIIYIIQMFLLKHKHKGLIVVPTVSLVEQLYQDFVDYSVNIQFPIEKAFHKIYQGKEKKSNSRVYISTWQSLQKQNKYYFEEFDFVIGDEVHLFEAKVCSGIMEKQTNAYFRIGLTGTIEDAKTSELSLKSMFGPIKRYSSTKDLMDRKVLQDLKVRPLILKHDRARYLAERKGTKYTDEMDYLTQSKPRNDFIVKLQKGLKGNVLVLFQYVDKHGKPLFKRFKEEIPEKKTHLVYGGTDADQREKVREICQKTRDNIIEASYGVFSTGVNIVNIDYIIFQTQSKGKVRVLQSIGRGLRRGSDKEVCTLLDLVDDLSGDTKSISYSQDHFEKRLDIYIREGFDVETKTFTI